MPEESEDQEIEKMFKGLYAGLEEIRVSNRKTINEALIVGFSMGIWATTMFFIIMEVI